MHTVKKLLIRILIAVALSCSVINITMEAMAAVTEAAVKEPSVKIPKKTLYVGYQSYKIEFNNLSSKASISYKSSNTKVAGIDKNGMVTPLAKGRAVITATIRQNDKTYHAKLTVEVKEPYIRLTSSTEFMNVGDTYLFTGKVYGSNSSVKWSVSDKKTASISSQGKLKALSAGKVTVTAKANNASISCDVMIGTNRIGTFQTNITCSDEITLWLSLSKPMVNEKLNGDTGSRTLDFFDYEWGSWTEDNTIPVKIIPKKAGKDTLLITSSKSTDGIRINITVTGKPVSYKALTATEIYSKCGPATVEIKVNSDYLGDGLGSGFFIGNGMVVTNYHVIEGADKIVVTTQDKKNYEVNTIIGYNKSLDLAILETKVTDKSLVISRDGVLTGATIYALGSPFGLTGTLSNGMVSTASRIIDNVDYIQLTASISPGNSGGPLINEYGEVVGVNTMYYNNGQNLNFAINISELNKINTNNPISVNDYYKEYMQEIKKKYMDSIIKEDTSLSKNPDNCQDIYPWIGVQGTLAAGEAGDYYKFKVKNPVNFAGMIMSENEEDLKITYMEVYDYTSKRYAAAQENEEKLTQYMYYPNLLPGEYYVKISVKDGYNGKDIPYMFILGYDD